MKNMIVMQKSEAVERMKILKLLPACIDDFVRHGKVRMSMHGILFDLNNEYQKMIDEWEKATENLAYHVIFNDFNFGKCLSILYVSKDTDEWSEDRECLSDSYPLVYVINLDCSWCSEYGYIETVKCSGGLIRIR